MNMQPPAVDLKELRMRETTAWHWLKSILY